MPIFSEWLDNTNSAYWIHSSARLYSPLHFNSSNWYEKSSPNCVAWDMFSWISLL